MIRSLPSESVEYVEFGVYASDDPRTGAISIGFSDTSDAPLVWHPGVWSAEQRSADIGGMIRILYVARFLFGTGTLDLAEGTYQPWLRFVGGAEDAVILLEDDTVQIT